MHVFTKRNALVGWIATRIARRRLERKLNEIAGYPRRRRSWPAVAAGVAAGGLAVGTLVARRGRTGELGSA